MISAMKDLQVAKFDYDAAVFKAESIISKANSEGAAIKAKNVAEASVIENKVETFNSGINLARYTF